MADAEVLGGSEEATGDAEIVGEIEAGHRLSPKSSERLKSSKHARALAAT